MQPNGDESGTRRGLDQRYTVQEAAELLDTTVDGVRSRIRRGTLDSEKIAGTVFILLDPDQVGAGWSRPEESEPSLAESWPSLDQSIHDLLCAKDESIASLKDQVEHLRGQLDIRAEELRRKDHLLAALTERIPELEPAKEAPPGPRQSPVSPSEEQNRGDVPPQQERPVSWWRRLFSG